MELPMPALDLRIALAAPPLRHELQAMVRRRVPRAEVEDIVQSVLCDALAAYNVPADPAEIPRWVMGIARHKVADFHRRARRDAWTPERPVEAVAAVATEAPEDRDLLARIVTDSGRSPEHSRLLGWLVREHAGDRLVDIAQEERLPSEVVRQRVSRFRRHLRARWLLAAAALVLLATASVRAIRDGAAPHGDAMATAGPSTILRVSEVRLDPEIDAARAAAIESEARLATVRISADVVTIETPARTLRGRLETADDHHSRNGVLRLDDGRVFDIELEPQGGGLIVRTPRARVVLTP
jgi:DNA-directed RNA polymerase specialized sigma24 family protein